MKKIILTTLNARYTHSSIGLRYLLANLKELESVAEIIEFTINENIVDMAEKILNKKPKIIGIGVYIWNAKEVSELIETIKQVSPKTKIVLGGAEASHKPFRVNFDKADYIIQGEGEEAFYELCNSILNDNLPKEKIIKAKLIDLREINLPYICYSDEDVKNRYIYVEASRGCPYLCEFCLSSIDERVRYFDIDKLLEEFELLWQRGVRSFKFIDRTFNLNMKFATKLLDFFLAKEAPYFLHFEVIPDNFPESLKEKIKLFPPASLQLEVGIQTLNPSVALEINRKLNIEKIKKNIHFLENETNAHLHVDLIVGLPSETLESFGKNLNLLTSITHSEIQIGILKKLSGTTLFRHDEKYRMVYSNTPPYQILQNELIPFKQMQKIKRFARFWDLTYNSGNFKESIKMIWEDSNVYESFFKFSEWIYSQTESTWQISLNRLSELLFNYLVSECKKEENFVAQSITNDIMKVSGRKLPPFLRKYDIEIVDNKKELSNINKRQMKHI